MHAGGAAVQPRAASHGAPAPRRAWMHRLAIRDFRNLRRVTLAPPADGTVLIGDNGHGKTNFLEAVYYLRLLRSVRGARDTDVVMFGAAGFHLDAELHGARTSAVEVGFDAATRRKRVALDGADAPRLVDGLGAFPAVMFSPADAEIVSGAPALRRRFLDMTLALTSTPYLAALSSYRAALAQRNAALRAPRGPVAAMAARAAAWEPALAEHGAVIWRARLAWVAEHASHYAELCAAIGERGAAVLAYASALEPPADSGVAALRAAFERARPTDLKRGLTTLGPHRDDLALALGGRDLRAFGSAGQHRTAAIALRLLESATVRAAEGTEPLVLLDDPFAELDTRRTARILELLGAEGRGQTMLAVPRESDIPQGLTRLERWRVTDGTFAAAGG
jgi:DNA replication and repair protein RecF